MATYRSELLELTQKNSRITGNTEISVTKLNRDTYVEIRVTVYTNFVGLGTFYSNRAHHGRIYLYVNQGMRKYWNDGGDENISGSKRTTVGTYTYTVNRGKQSEKIKLMLSTTVGLSLRAEQSDSTITTSKTLKILDIPEITIDALPHNTVRYFMNGGVGVIGDQTKWMSESLRLSSIIPIFEGRTFIGWASNLERASSGTVSYLSGGLVPRTAYVSTLYAVWELPYTMPKILNLSVERCDEEGNLNDFGGYARVSFDWSVYTSEEAQFYGGETYPYVNNGIGECIITVGEHTITPELSGTSGNEVFVIGSGDIQINEEYNTIVSITDTQTVKEAHTTIGYTVLPNAEFPLDVNREATAVGILRPAPDDGEGLYLGKDLFLPIDTTAQSGTDKEIYDALVGLGWDSDVII